MGPQHVSGKFRSSQLAYLLIFLATSMFGHVTNTAEMFLPLCSSSAMTTGTQWAAWWGQ